MRRAIDRGFCRCYRAIHSRDDRTDPIPKPKRDAAGRPRRAAATKGRLGMGNRGTLLLATVVLAITLAACGRASDLQINQALGITPTPTQSAEEIASATSAAVASATESAIAEEAPAGEPLGDARRGERQFTTQCVGCHRAGGQGPEILEPGSPGSDVTPDSLLALVRDGTGHPEGSTYSSTQLTDSQVNDLAAYILSEAAP